MAIGTQNDFSMRSGDSRTLQVTINDDTGSPLDITGASVIWALSKKAVDTVAPKGAALLTKTLASGIVVVLAASGRIDITVAAADTDALSGEFYHELQMTTASSEISTVLYGQVTIAKDLI